jgi:hypothetical protein
MEEAYAEDDLLQQVEHAALQEGIWTLHSERKKNEKER